jgi:hypothetical protein
MSLDGNDRLRRIERLLRELRYECERGVMEREIPEESVQFGSIVPISNFLGRNHCVRGTFRLEPIHIGNAWARPDNNPMFKVIDGGKK